MMRCRTTGSLTVARRLAEDFGDLVEEALGEPGEPRPREGDLDHEFEQNPEAREQVARAIERLKRGELGVPQGEVERRFRD